MVGLGGNVYRRRRQHLLPQADDGLAHPFPHRRNVARGINPHANGPLLHRRRRHGRNHLGMVQR